MTNAAATVDSRRTDRRKPRRVIGDVPVLQVLAGQHAPQASTDQRPIVGRNRTAPVQFVTN